MSERATATLAKAEVLLHARLMNSARKFRLKAVDYDQQALMAPPPERHMLKLLADTCLQLADREEVRARLGERRSFAPTGEGDVAPRTTTPASTTSASPALC